MEIPELRIHIYKDGRKKVILGDLDLSMLVSDVKIDMDVGSIPYAIFKAPAVRPIIIYEE
jgi:hypothetical protein